MGDGWHLFEQPATNKGDNMKQVPYKTRTGVEIGSNYHPDMRPEITEDMELIQSVLLGEYRSVRQQQFHITLYLLALIGVLWAAVVFAK